MAASANTIATAPVAALAAQCCQSVALDQVPAGGYRPLAQHLLFFTLVWVLKQKVADPQHTDLFADLDLAMLRAHMEQVTQQLALWGPAVTGLKENDQQEWELLRIQIEKTVERAARDYHCQERADLKAEAMGNALLKLLEIVHKLPTAHTIETTTDVVTLVVSQRAEFTNLYDFSSPFYPFARRIARNELITLLRREQRERTRLQPLEETEPTLIVPPPMPEGDEEVAYRAAQYQLQTVLYRLLELVQTELTPKPRRVVLQTLAARSQFWRALTLTELPPPADFPPPVESRTDAELGTVLKLSENSVRVHRSTAKKCIQEIDPALGQLLDRLMTPHGS